jgi:dUTP pyrophosphatase
MDDNLKPGQREAELRLIELGGSQPDLVPGRRRRPWSEDGEDLQIELTILDPRLPEWGFPHRGSDGAAGLDLFACLQAPLVLEPGSAAILIPAGFALHIADPGWCGVIAPRSGLGHRGLVLGNGVGVIDADYTGPVMISAWNRGAAAVTVRPGDRIAQMLFVPVAHPTFTVVEGFTAATGRGAGGFGSTGLDPVSRPGTPGDD